MTAPFALDIGVVVMIAISLAIAAAAAYNFRELRRKNRSGWVLRVLSLIVSLGAVSIAVAIGMPRVFQAPAVIVSVDGVWCAPWSQALAWRDVLAIRSIEESGYESSSRYGDGPSIEALQLVHSEPRTATLSPVPWHGGHRAQRPLSWLTRWSFAPIRDALNGDNDRPAMYCNTANLDLQNFQLKRLADSLVDAYELSRDPSYAGYLAVIRLCEQDGRALDERCVNYIWPAHRRCESQAERPYNDCLAGFLDAS